MSSAFLDFFAHFCLRFGHITFILPLVIICMIFSKRDICVKAACFLLWVMIFNTLLKYLFRVPLFPHLGPGYAFPSGHMHAAAVFYGYIICGTNSRTLKICLTILLCALGFSLIHCQFHDLTDIIGAVGFAIVELAICHFLSAKFGDKAVGFVAVISAIAFTVTLGIMYKVEFHVWLAFYALIGTEICICLAPSNELTSLSKKITALLIASVAIFVTNYLFSLVDFREEYLAATKFVLIPFIIIGAMQLSKQIKT